MLAGFQSLKCLDKVTPVFNWLTCSNIAEFTSQIYDALRDLAQYAQVKKNVKNTHGGVLLLVKLQVKSYSTLVY